jgi:hypothetical protein
LHPALCTASTSRVKLCATSLTFDNRCSFGNYSPMLAASSLLHFTFVFFPQTIPASLSFCPRRTSKCNL